MKVLHSIEFGNWHAPKYKWQEMYEDQVAMDLEPHLSAIRYHRLRTFMELFLRPCVKGLFTGRRLQ